ncbi:DUF3375 family protein [Cellulomonas sp. 179-A 9B4 NHS]|uniref:DUF3375 family protein n=1 Tax=Cellulomonas sp. 179-A 9B4 NHS TaxID=3142379 RepID=UPI00399FE2B7
MTHAPGAAGRLARFEQAKARPEMALLRAHSVEWVLSIFAEHLAAGPVEVAHFHEVVDVELAQLRAAGSPDLQESTRTARDYCNDWVARQWVNRALVDGVEQYTLTAAALDVLAFADRLVDRRSTVSESRLQQILDAVARLSDDADPDPQRRVDRIDEQIAALQAQREALLAGDVPPTPPARLHEQLHGVMDLARHLPADFKRVADSVYTMHRRFVGEAEDEPAGRGRALQAFFADHDLLEASAEGRAFRGLMRLWGSHRAQAALRRDIDALLSQDFAAELTPEQRRALRTLPRTLVDAAEDVQDTYRRLTQSLERFVQHRSEGDRDLRARLARAQAAAHALFGQGARRVQVELQLGAGLPEIQSIAQVQLADPGLRERPPVLDEVVWDDGGLTPAQIRELGGPDLDEIRRAVATATATAGSGRPTLGEVWAALPPEQRRPRNVVGLLHVAVAAGATFLDDTGDRLEAVRTDGSRVVCTVPWAVLPAPAADLVAEPGPVAGPGAVAEPQTEESLA